jgi:hypothetical protein
MRRTSAIALGSVLLLGAAGCGNFLSGPGLSTHDPNSVSGLTDAGPLYDGVEVGQMSNYSTQFARTMAEYTQQVAGVSRQQQGWDLYLGSPGATNGIFDAFWAALGSQGQGGGGAADLRIIQQIAQKQHDSIYVGIAKVWEAMLIGDAASVWGAVPYSQAFNTAQYPQPKYDPQITALNEVQTTLDDALIYLSCDTTGSTNLGPTGVLPRGVARTAEIIYAGQTPGTLVQTYKQVAHTLKARFYMHLASVDPTNYAKALAEAQKGIASPANDWNWFASTQLTNRWVDFMGNRADIAPGAALVHLMKTRIANGLDIDNGRFGFYFVDGESNPKPCTLSGNALMPDSGCTGNRPGGNTVLPDGEGFSGFNVWNNGGSFKQPQVTYTETQLIVAEAALQTGNAALAQTSLNNVRNNETYGADAAGDFSNCSPTCTFKAQPVVPATMENIVEEEYIDLMGYPEVYNTYKRTCLPSLAAAPESPESAVPRAAIPGRIAYSQTAIAVDPNTPNVGPTARNDNQPAACPSLTYSSTPTAW